VKEEGKEKSGERREERVRERVVKRGEGTMYISDLDLILVK